MSASAVKVLADHNPPRLRITGCAADFYVDATLRLAASRDFLNESVTARFCRILPE